LRFFATSALAGHAAFSSRGHCRASRRSIVTQRIFSPSRRSIGKARDPCPHAARSGIAVARTAARFNVDRLAGHGFFPGIIRPRNRFVPAGSTFSNRAGDPSPAGLRVADALAGNAPRSSRAKTGVPRPACFCITWPGLDIPAALMGFIQAVLIPTYRPAACFHVAIAAPDFAAAAKTGLFLPADCRHLYNFSAPTVRKPSSTRHFRAKLILSMGAACNWPSLADNARYFCLNLFRRL
jgi:hypothetical protein